MNNKASKWINTQLIISLVLCACLPKPQTPNPKFPEQQNEVKPAIDSTLSSTVDINELDDFFISKISDFYLLGMTVGDVMGDQYTNKALHLM